VTGTTAAGQGLPGKVTTITRTDGSHQLTYNGHPLYTYIGDTAPGQARGNNIMGFPSQRGEILLRERSSPMGETRRKFDKDFREGAVRLVRETGKPIAQVARDLGINSGTLGNWVDADRRRRGEGDGALSEDERAELARLRKENAELAMRCDVLKRSVALWVSDAMGR
jgi:transposase